MNEVIKNIMERRAIRKYKPEQISDEELNLIIAAGSYAPCAGGRQSPMMVVVQNKSIIFKLGRINQQIFYQQLPPNIKLKVSDEQPSIADDKNIANAFYGAPTLITIFTPKAYSYGVADGSILIENMMLAAHSLGVGSCYIGRAAETVESAEGREITRDWRVSDEYVAIGHCILGYPEGDHPKAKQRKDFVLKRIN